MITFRESKGGAPAANWSVQVNARQTEGGVDVFGTVTIDGATQTLTNHFVPTPPVGGVTLVVAEKQTDGSLSVFNYNVQETPYVANGPSHVVVNVQTRAGAGNAPPEVFVGLINLAYKTPPPGRDKPAMTEARMLALKARITKRKLSAMTADEKDTLLTVLAVRAGLLDEEDNPPNTPPGKP